MSILPAILTAALSVTASDIKSDEVVVFYPAYARLENDGDAWRFVVHGCIYEPEASSWRRGVAVSALRKALDVEGGTPEAAVFDRRIRLFMVDNERGKDISVRLGRNILPIGTSAANGHFQGTVRVSTAEAERLVGKKPVAGQWIDYRAVTDEDDRRRFGGRVQLVGPRGLSIVSDLDDTIKHTQVRDRKAMLANTFLREFRAVPGMAALYQKAARAGVAFHYVSGSPWQLYRPLSAFSRSQGFPAGSFHLKDFRLKDSTALNVLGSQEEYKIGHIEPILDAFPQRRFIFIGDSGEQDPEIYGRLARERPRQVVAIWIRNVSGESAQDARFRKAFEGIDAERWWVFNRAEELDPPLAPLIGEQKR